MRTEASKGGQLSRDHTVGRAKPSASSLAALFSLYSPQPATRGCADYSLHTRPSRAQTLPSLATPGWGQATHSVPISYPHKDTPSERWHRPVPGGGRVLSRVGWVVISLREDFLGPEHAQASLWGHGWSLDPASKQPECPTAWAQNRSEPSGLKPRTCSWGRSVTQVPFPRNL